MAKSIISEKSTKSVILGAYTKLLKEIKEKQSFHPQEEKTKKEDKELLSRVSSFSFEEIVKGLTDIKLKVSKNLETLQESLLDEYKKFTVLQRGVELSKKDVEELHEISINANSLAALIQAQKQLKEECNREIEEKTKAFETDMENKRTEWEEEKMLFEKKTEEERETINKERTREEETYQYNLKLSRRKELDAYEEKKQVTEREIEENKSEIERTLQEKEKALEEREKKLDDLTRQTEEFPAILEQKVAHTRTQVEEEVKGQYHFQIELAKKEQEGEKKLHEQQIASLQSKIKEQEMRINQLTQRVNESGHQVQDIALKAVEGAAQLRSYERTSGNKNAND